MNKTDSSKNNNNELQLNKLSLPSHVSHLKVGSTLCTNGYLLILQDGPTTLELRRPPKFEAKQVPWSNGLIRDIAWCPRLHLFALITKNSLFTFDSEPLDGRQSRMMIYTDSRLKMKVYESVEPHDRRSSFWRCTFIGKTLYISHAGLGTVIDAYNFKSETWSLLNRWKPPNTCAPYEGIWSIRSHSNAEHMGMMIMDERDNSWRFELRNRNNLSILWQLRLPIGNGDCELTPLPKNEWLAINACGIRLIHFNDSGLKAAVEYERELKNAILVDNDYLLVRTKATLDIHDITKK